MDEISEKMHDTDDIYYLSYAMMYYMMWDGIASAFTGGEDESAMYVNIYDKKVGELINEGKEFMESNGVTIDKFRNQVMSYTF